MLEKFYAQREPLYSEIADVKIVTAQQSVNGLVSQLAKKSRLRGLGLVQGAQCKS